MASQDALLEFEAQRGLGNRSQRAGIWIISLVGVKIEAPAIAAGNPEHPVETLMQAGTHIGDRAERRVGSTASVDHIANIPHMRVVQHVLDAKQRACLQVETAGPGLAQFGKNRPRHARLQP